MLAVVEEEEEELDCHVGFMVGIRGDGIDSRG
jgi:hypothetical protein